jgi:hypothetical protein
MILLRNTKNYSLSFILVGYPIEGIYTGLVGARFEKYNLMESQHILVQSKWNTLV